LNGQRSTAPARYLPFPTKRLDGNRPVGATTEKFNIPNQIRKFLNLATIGRKQLEFGGRVLSVAVAQEVRLRTPLAAGLLEPAFAPMLNTSLAGVPLGASG
jgi:hypothetical protein